MQKAASNVREAFDEIDDNVLAYCSLDAKVLPQNACSGEQFAKTVQRGLNSCRLQGARRLRKQSLGEKEQEFLGALRVSNVSCQVQAWLSSKTIASCTTVLLASKHVSRAPADI